LDQEGGTGFLNKHGSGSEDGIGGGDRYGFKEGYEQLKKQLFFNLREKEVLKKLGIPADAFIPLLFSINFGGDWSFKTEFLSVLAVKEKITRYNSEKMTGFTLEKIFLFLNPEILKEEGVVHRLEKCGHKKEREIVKRPYKIELDGEDIIEALLNPLKLKITLRHIEGPLTFEGSAAYGISHEMDHLKGSGATGKSLWDFKYELEY
jgi:predicted metalloprotease